MIDRTDKSWKPIEVSAGLLVGYFIAGLLNMALTGTKWNEAFTDEKLLTGFAGIAVSLFIYLRKKKRAIQEEE